MSKLGSGAARMVFVALLGAGMAQAADAYDGRRVPRSSDGVVGYVTVESRYHPTEISGPVRRTSRGLLEVRMPGGTWIDCGRSCANTLRRETIDFWESRGGPNNPYVDGPGYFSWRR